MWYCELGGFLLAKMTSMEKNTPKMEVNGKNKFVQIIIFDRIIFLL
jgi:hypothetical protein